MSHNTKRMYPVQLMLDDGLRRKMAAVSERTSLSMSLLARISLDRLLRDLGDPEEPDMAVLMRYLGECRDASRRA